MEGIQSLSTLANTAASAIDNSLMHEKVKELNAKLQKKVDVSTEELKRTNLELKSSQEDLRTAYDELKEVNRELDERIGKLSTSPRCPGRSSPCATSTSCCTCSSSRPSSSSAPTGAPSC